MDVPIIDINTKTKHRFLTTLCCQVAPVAVEENQYLAVKLVNISQVSRIHVFTYVSIVFVVSSCRRFLAHLSKQTCVIFTPKITNYPKIQLKIKIISEDIT